MSNEGVEYIGPICDHVCPDCGRCPECCQCGAEEGPHWPGGGVSDPAETSGPMPDGSHQIADPL